MIYWYLAGSLLMVRSRKLVLWLSIIVVTVVALSFLAYKSFSGRAESAALNSGADELKGDKYSNVDDTENSEQYTVQSGLPGQDMYGNSQEDYDSITGVTAEKGYGEKLVEKGSTNILILGEDKVSYLYDTVGIISIDKNNKKVKIIMIPRDTYIQYNKKVLKVLEDAGKLNVPGIFKINYAHHIGPLMEYEGKFNPFTSINFLSDVIKEKFGIVIDDYLKVNTEGFAEIVDLFGGIDIDVPYDMNYFDPTQDLTIDLKKGMQHLDGKQAEGFVRFRQGFKEDGSFFEIGDDGRKVNQVNFLKVFIKQYGTIGNVDKIPGLMKTMGKNLQHSIGFGDILFKYIGTAKDIVAQKYEIKSVALLSNRSKWVNGSKYMVLGEE